MVNSGIPLKDMFAGGGEAEGVRIAGSKGRWEGGGSEEKPLEGFLYLTRDVSFGWPSR